MIFISYRISDSLDLVGRLDADLINEFGEAAVFRDKSRLHGGDDFTQELEKNAKSCPVMLVVIGATWQTTADKEGDWKGVPRLLNPKDWVRKEITLALDAGNIVIPVFLNDAAMPSQGWLANCQLDRLYPKQGEKIRSTEYINDLTKLIALLRKKCPHLPGKSAGTPTPPAAESDASLLRRYSLDAKKDFLVEILPNGDFRPWEMTKVYFSIGRSQATIQLSDKHISRRHLVLARLGPDWIVINVSKAYMFVNGWPLRQKTLRNGDVIQIGRTSFVFLKGSRIARPRSFLAGCWKQTPFMIPEKAISPNADPEPSMNDGFDLKLEDPNSSGVRFDSALGLSPERSTPGDEMVAPQLDIDGSLQIEEIEDCDMSADFGESGPGPDLENISKESDGFDFSVFDNLFSGYCELVGLDGASSDSVDQPLVIGSHSRCPIQINEANIAPFHCFLGWLPHGIYLVDLGSGRGTLLDGLPVKRRKQVLLKDGQKITIGRRTLEIRIKGDPKEPANARNTSAPITLSMTAIYGPHVGETAHLGVNRVMTLGRNAACHFIFSKDLIISRRHAEFRLQETTGNFPKYVVKVRHIGQRHPTAINGERLVGERAATVGDLIHFYASKKKGASLDILKGTALVLHFDLTRDAW